MSASQNRDDTDIAVIGISAILASGENLNENWESIRAGLNHVSDLPADRVDVTAYFNPDKTAKDQVYCKRGYFIPDYELDPRDYGLNFNQVEDSDANQLLTLLKVKEALSDAKIHPVSKERRNVGVVLGIGGGQKASHEFYSRLNYVVMEKVLRKMGMPDEDVKIAIDKYKSQFPEWRVDSFPGFLGNVTAGRCCNVFNLDGMNCVVDAACASSLIALKVAIDELLYGDCDTMVCGATCTDNSLGMYMAFSKTPVFSTDPAVRAYDENTKGMLIGEGSVMMVLKKLSKAVADGDEIHAVIRGVASSSDGKAPGIYVPTVSGQELCIQRAWEKVKAEMKTCTLLEGHGTGTPVGDKIELTGMRNQFQTHAGCAKEQIAVGSIKSQVGHTKAVAGFAGLVKVILSLKHKTLPLTINVQNPPKLMDGTDLTDTCLYVNLKNRPWFVPREIGIRRAGISSFGFGGANYHMVVEEYEQEHTKPYRMHDMALPIVIHATNARELVAELRSVIAKIEPLAFSNDKTPQDEAYDLLMTYRKEHEVGAKPGAVPASSPRVGLLASDKPRDFVTDLKNIADAIERDSNATEIKLRADLIYRSKGMDLRGKVAALFAGQGSQYLNMYEDVAMNFPEFRQAVVDMDKASSQICGVRASSFMYPRAPYQKEGEELIKKQEKEISTVQNAQLAITAVSIGGFAIFQRAGFKPDFVAGHSLGEYAAMHACGALDRAEVCELVCARAHAMQNAFQKGEDLGKMIAVVGDNVESKVRPEAEGVWVANMNSPSQVVLTGTQKGIEQDAARLTGLGFRVVTLNTGGAFHSPKMAPAERVFYERLAASKINPIAHDAPRAYANVSGSVYPAGDAEEVRRTLAKQMTSAVQFTSQIRQMYKDGARVFVEFGPKNVLAKLVQQILADANDVACVSLNASPNRSSDAQLREAALQCAVLGVPFSSPFDPWGKRNPFKGIGGFFSDREADLKARQSKTRIKLSAATYVSKKTLEERTRLMNDGRILSCFTASSPRSAGNPDAASSSLKEELARLRSQLEDAKREAAEKKLEAEKLRQIVETTKAQSSDSMTANQKLHLDQLLRNYEDLTKQIKSVLVGAAPSPAIAAPVSVPVAPLSLSAPAPATTIAATPAASTSGRLGRAEVESTLKNALGELTGFDIGLVTMDLSLEDDLGIDSIKRVEFVSNVSAKFGVTVGPEAMDKLARTRLVGEVVEVFVSTLGASGSSAPAPVTAAPVAVAKSVAASTGGFDRAFVTKTLNKVLSASTGFAEDLISEDMSLEDDLGVDSIKRVELVSAASADLNVTVSQEAMTELSRSRTVGDVINAFFAHVGSSSPAPAAASAAPVTSKPAAVSTAPAATGGFDRSKVIKTLNKVLAASTGFSEDLISEDMSLEDDLGVDSIKRVELVSAASADLNVTVSQEAMTELSRSRTVGDVINAFFNHVGGSAAPAVASAPMVAAAPVASAAGGFDRAKVIKTLNKVLSASTGFSEDLISEDMSLEDDLGVDSIKRVELVSAASADLNVTVSPQAMTELSRSRTVGDVINAFFNHVGGSASAAPAAAAPVAAAKVASAPAAATGGFNRGQVIKTLNKVLSASTGFSEDLISEDMSLEDDLGVDSIKRVELVSAASADLNVTVSQEAMTELSRSRTVGDVINAFFNHVGGSAAPAAAPAPVAASPVAIAAPAKSASAASGFSRDQVIKTLNKVLSASTGFSEDLISEDMSLEDDLGVDSIKRVELVSAASADLNVTVSQEAMTELSRSRTVGDVINAFFNHVGGSTASAAAPVAAAPVSAAKPASAPATGGFSRDQVIKTLNKVLSASTGFSEDLISEDMSLEDDLGVDSIKRVELVSAASADMSVTVSQEAMTELSRSRTVGDVINAFFNHVGGSASAAPAAVAPAPSAPVPAAAPAKPAASGFSRDQVIKTLNKVLSASTGFSEDLISEDMSLEDDLGVDSIKRVELVSAASADLNVTVSQEAMTELSRSRTVGDVINAFFNHVGGSAAPAATPAAAAPAATAPAPAPAAAASNGMDRAQVTKVLQQVLSDSTGFSEDLITEDMSLEDDLGVDSIKRVELVSSASATLQVSVSPQAMTELSRSRTVGDVINAFFTHVGSSSSAAAPSAAPVSNGDGAVKPIRAADCGHLTLTYAEAVVIPAPDRQALERPVDRPTLILDDGTGLASQLAEKLGAGALVLTTVANGKKSIVMKDYTEASFEQALAQVVNQFGKPGGFVFLPNANQDISKQMAFAMLAAKQLKPYLADVPVTRGRSFFIGVARMDGKLGLGGCADVKNDDLVAVAERGAIFGLCKTLDLEWPHVFSRGVDLDVKLSNDKCVEFLLRELDDPNLNVREVGYSAADLKRRTTKALPLVPTAKANKAKISKSDVFIVTGGARGITPLCVAEVARLARGGTFFLLGRSKVSPEPAWANGKATGKELDDAATAYAKAQFAAGKGEKPTPKVVRALSNSVEATREIAESLAMITAAGGKAEYISADVSNPEAVTKALQGRAGSVTGLIHASGVLRDKMIQNKTMDDFEAVYGTKVYGLRALLKALPPKQLKHMIVFSSLAGFHGNRGQADYALANEVLNKSIHVMNARFPNCDARALDFGPWGGGMVTPQLQKMFEDQGVEIIPRSGGAVTVANVLFSTNQAQALFGNWGLPPVKPIDGTVKVQRTFLVAGPENKFLDSHKFKNKRVLPFTLMSAAMGQMAVDTHPGYHLHSLQDVQLFRGFVAPDNENSMPMTFTLVDGREEAGKLEVDVSVTSILNGKEVPSYRCKAVLGPRPRSGFSVQPLSKEDLTSKFKTSKEVYDNVTLFHGPDFQSISGVNLVNESKLVAECKRVNVQDQGQFAANGPVDGFTLDTAFQLALVSARVLKNVASLPNFAKSFDFYREIPVGEKFYGVLLKDAEGEAIKGDVTMAKHQFYFCDAEGNVFMGGRISIVLSAGLTW